MEFVTEEQPPPNAPDRPPVPRDLVNHPATIKWCEGNAATFHRGDLNWCGDFSHRGNRTVSRRALLAILTPEQYAQLYYYGFVELVGQPCGRRYRVHYHSGNNVSVLNSNGYAYIGLCCYVATECFDDTFISNILALRTNDREFRDTACTEPPYEYRRDDTYPY